MAALRRLPLPSGEKLRDAYLAIAADRVAVEADELDELVMRQCDVDPEDELVEALLDQVTDELWLADYGPLALLARHRGAPKRDQRRHRAHPPADR